MTRALVLNTQSCCRLPLTLQQAFYEPIFFATSKDIKLLSLLFKAQGLANYNANEDHRESFATRYRNHLKTKLNAKKTSITKGVRGYPNASMHLFLFIVDSRFPSIGNASSTSHFDARYESSRYHHTSKPNADTGSARCDLQKHPDRPVMTALLDVSMDAWEPHVSKMVKSLFSRALGTAPSTFTRLR